MKNPMSCEALILKKRRKELNMTQTDVANAIGIQLQQYQLFEYGTRKVSTSSMLLGLRLCAVLELDPYASRCAAKPSGGLCAVLPLLRE